MPYRISYKPKGSSHRKVHGGDRPATFSSKKAAKNYVERYSDLFRIRGAKIYHVKRRS